VIYCVVPAALADALYDRLVEHYRDEPGVEVVVDRRSGPDRRGARGTVGKEQRHTRDRRRRGIAGTFPPIEVPE
jgi:hypothetical protein